MRDQISEYTFVDIANFIQDKSETIKKFYSGPFPSTAKLNYIPLRATYFGISLCTAGEVILEADLGIYQVKENSLTVMEPEVIRKWSNQSDNFTEQYLFFSPDYFLDDQNKYENLVQFPFFLRGSIKVLELCTADCQRIRKILQEITEINRSKSIRATIMIRSYINIILNLIADIYDQQYLSNPVARHTKRDLVIEFKTLLLHNYKTIRSVNRYAELLFVTPKHLSETTKQITGKTAGQWIQNYLITEAKVQLKQTTLTINQISHSLNFPDASIFGKYFRKYTGCSPSEYRTIS